MYRIIWGRDSILVRAGGTGLRYGDSTPLSLPLPPGFAINDLKWVPVGHDLLVFYEATDMDGATSFAARLDGTTLAIQWLDSLIGFNLGTPILDSTSAFVANISILARLDLTTGAFLWRVDDFYRVSGCDAYDYPTLRADSLILRCSGTRPDYYHRRSGQLLRRGA